METHDLKNIIDAIIELHDDRGVPKNVRTKLMNIVDILNSGTEVNIKVNKALDELDEIQSDANLQPFTRTQIWNIASALETV